MRGSLTRSSGRARGARAGASAAVLAAAGLLAAATPVASADDSAAPAAPAAPAPEPQPRIVFASKLHEVGRLVMGKPAAHTYRFKNQGTADLAIRRVKPACGCTAALVTRKVVAPGEEGAIEVTFDSTDRHGFQDLQVQVVTNDPSERDAGDCTSLLYLRVEVVTIIDVLPMTLYFASFRKGTEPARDLAVLPKVAGALTVTAAEPSAPWLEATIAPHSAGSRTGAKVRVRARSDAPLGRIDEHVVIRTDHPEQPVVRVPIIGAVHGDVVAFPDRLALAPRPGEPGEATVVVKRLAGAGPIGLYRTEVPDFLEAFPEDLIPGNQTEVLLKVRPGLAPGPYAGVVRLFLDQPDLPLALVPITVVVPPRVRVEPPAAWFDAQEPKAARIFVDVPDGHRVVSVSGPKALAAAAYAAGWLVVPPPDAAALAKLGPPGASAGEPVIVGSVRVTTDVPGEESIDVPVVVGNRRAR